MKEDMETTKSEAQENEGTSRRGFIAKTLFAGASLAAGSLALAASQNQASAQTGKRKNERANNTKIAANSLPGRRPPTTAVRPTAGKQLMGRHRP